MKMVLLMEIVNLMVGKIAMVMLPMIKLLLEMVFGLTYLKQLH